MFRGYQSPETLLTIRSDDGERPDDDGVLPGSDRGDAPECPEKWGPLVLAIQRGEAGATEELYQIISSGVRFKLLRELPWEEVDDRLHNTFLIVLEAVRDNRLRNPEALLAFVWTVAQRQTVAYVRDAVQDRKGLLFVERESDWPALATSVDVEEQLISRELVAIAWSALDALSERDREILSRFYLQDQDANQIRREMGLTETQYRLLKSRAKAKFEAAGSRALTKPVQQAGRRDRKPNDRSRAALNGVAEQSYCAAAAH